MIQLILSLDFELFGVYFLIIWIKFFLFSNYYWDISKSVFGVIKVLFGYKGVAVSEVNFFLLFGDFKLCIWSEKLYLELKVVFGCKGCIWSKFKLLFGVFKFRIWSEKLYLELK